ncbi:8535_t:CDS:2 [Acaulospora morrowiae]|uniref:8535_t:CDS:1 n=1 Tax=Acaulospora morrowiae TaxID=94023 RepID=A0A9N9BKN2_9GLOM|nr:8535_t:CDS:2 [Acaulospora morrowiae]
MSSILPNQTLYVRNLNEKINKEELRRSLYSLFSAYGRILDIVALKTIKMRGQAFIVFKEIQSATTAMRGLNGFMFYDKPMTCVGIKIFRVLRLVVSKYGLIIPSFSILQTSEGESARLNESDFILRKFFASIHANQTQQIEYSKNKSDAVAKLDGTWRKPGVAAASTGSQRTLGQAAPAEKRQREEEEFANYKRAADGGKLTDRESMTPEIEMEDETDLSQPSGVNITKGEQEPLNRILYIQNLPPDVTDEMLSFLFEQYPGFKEVRLVPGKSDIAFVEYESDNQAAIAKEVLNGFKITHDKEMRVTFAKR